MRRTVLPGLLALLVLGTVLAGPAVASTSLADTATPAPATTIDPDATAEDGPSPVLLLAGALVAVGVVAGAIARYRSVTE